MNPNSGEFLRSDAWIKLRYQAIVKYGNRCMCCGALPIEDRIIINVDHIKPRKKYPDLALDINNLQILCDRCNKGKGNDDETDWRKNCDYIKTNRELTDKIEELESKIFHLERKGFCKSVNKKRNKKIYEDLDAKIESYERLTK